MMLQAGHPKNLKTFGPLQILLSQFLFLSFIFLSIFFVILLDNASLIFLISFTYSLTMAALPVSSLAYLSKSSKKLGLEDGVSKSLPLICAIWPFSTSKLKV